MHYSDFQRKSTLDFDKNDYDFSNKHFRSLVDSKLKGSTFDNFKVSSFNRKIDFIHQLQEPMYLMSYSSWCVPSNGELEALEAIIEEHADWVDFVLILWDNKKNALKFSRQFHHKTRVLYVDELYNSETKKIEILKHKLGVPVSFTIAKNKTVINIRKNTQIHPSVDVKTATKACYEDILKDIELLQYFENK